MERLFIVTGACGHLGNTIVKKLVEKKQKIRGFLLPNESSSPIDGLGVEIFRGDVCSIEDLEQLFKTEDDTEVIVIHTAGIVSIATKYQQKIYDVNVKGTENIIHMCTKHKVKRLIYVSSVHAIPEKPNNGLITEIKEFNTDNLVGLYAKTKALASQKVLDAFNNGLDAVIVHPSGIIGPYDYGNGHTTQMIIDYLEGRLTAAIDGGYDFVDVRDVADGIISAVDNGRSGETYILSNRYIDIKELLRLISKITGKKPIKTILPYYLAKITAPLAELYYKILRQTPIYTAYSIYTLKSNANFSYEKARVELGYSPREMYDTLEDTVKWIIKKT